MPAWYDSAGEVYMARRERAAVTAWLEQLGYQVAFRELGWTECLVSGPWNSRAPRSA